MPNNKSSQKKHAKKLKKQNVDFETAFSHPEIKPIKVQPKKQNPIAFIFTVLFVVIFILGMILPSLTMFF